MLTWRSRLQWRRCAVSDRWKWCLLITTATRDMPLPLLLCFIGVTATTLHFYWFVELIFGWCKHLLCSRSKLDVEKNIQNFVNVQQHRTLLCVLWVSVCVCVCECVCVSVCTRCAFVDSVNCCCCGESWTSSTRIWPHSLLSTGLGYWDYRTTYNNDRTKK